MVKNLVSIVVPVFNVQEYLCDCIESVLNQTYRDIEIILVDDGSTDNSGNICDYYGLKDNRIHVIHKNNGGLSDARNYGIEASKGNYIMFLDSDDYISNNCIEIMLTTMKKYNIEIVQGLFTRDSEKLGKGNCENISIYTSPMQVLKHYLGYNLLEGHACNKLYESKLFVNTRFPVGKIQEDAWTTYKTFYNAKGVGVINYYSYYYRYNDNSIMNGNFDGRRFEILKVPDQIRKYLTDNSASFSLDKDIEYFTMRLGLKTYNDCIQHKAEKRFDLEMNNIRNIISKLKMDYRKWGIKYSLMVLLMKCNYKIYNSMIRNIR